MAKGKIVYQNWIVDIGLDPGQIGKIELISDKIRPNEKIITAVRKAVAGLDRQGQEFIERYYFQGESYLEISKAMNKKISRVEGLHQRSKAKLKNRLAEFVRAEYGINVEIGRECLICQSTQRAQIDRLISAKKDSETWKKIIKKIKADYKIPVKTPQLLIGHKKYHMG